MQAVTGFFDDFGIERAFCRAAERIKQAAAHGMEIAAGEMA